MAGVADLAAQTRRQNELYERQKRVQQGINAMPEGSVKAALEETLAQRAKQRSQFDPMTASREDIDFQIEQLRRNPNLSASDRQRQLQYLQRIKATRFPTENRAKHGQQTARPTDEPTKETRTDRIWKQLDDPKYEGGTPPKDAGQPMGQEVIDKVNKLFEQIMSD